jgi:hypothetical protein
MTADGGGFWRHPIFVGVVTAVLSAGVIGVFGKLQGEWIVRALGGVTASELTEIENRLKVELSSSMGERGPRGEQGPPGIIDDATIEKIVKQVTQRMNAEGETSRQGISMLPSSRWPDECPVPSSELGTPFVLIKDVPTPAPQGKDVIMLTQLRNAGYVVIQENSGSKGLKKGQKTKIGGGECEIMFYLPCRSDIAAAVFVSSCS